MFSRTNDSPPNCLVCNTLPLINSDPCHNLGPLFLITKHASTLTSRQCLPHRAKRQHQLSNGCILKGQASSVVCKYIQDSNAEKLGVKFRLF